MRQIETHAPTEADREYLSVHVPWALDCECGSMFRVQEIIDALRAHPSQGRFWVYVAPYAGIPSIFWFELEEDAVWAALAFPKELG
jgi:hypothetical protein